MPVKNDSEKGRRKRIGIYLRISQDRSGEGESVERHERECRAKARLLGKVVEVFVDNDTEASSGKPRPDFERLLSWLEDDKLDVVIAWHSDRLLRSPVEMERYINICQPRDIPSEFVRAGRFDLSNAAGRMMARFHAIQARYEIEHMVERLQSKQTEKAQRGEWSGGTRPFGFGMPTGAVDRDGKPLHDMSQTNPAEAAEVLAAVRRVLGGESLGSIIKDWNARGIPTTGRAESWSYATLKQVLTRPRNIGLCEYNGELYPAQWPAIVPEDEFRAVCHLLADPSRRRSASNRGRWIGSGIFLCGADDCGLPVKVTWATNRRKERRRIYTCRKGSGHVYRGADDIDALIVGGTINGERVRGAVFERIAQPGFLTALAQLSETSGPDVDALRAERKAAQERLLEIDDMFGDSSMDRQRHARQSKRISDRIAELDDLLTPRHPNRAVLALAESADPRALWDTMPLAEQRSIVKDLMTVRIHRLGRTGYARVFDPRTVTIEFHSQAG